MEFYVIFGKTSFEEDFDSLVKFEDISPDIIYVFFSPEYFSDRSEILEKYSNVFRLVEPSTNIFPPEWRQSSTEYTCLRSLMYTDTVNVNFLTFDEEIFENMDYYTHTYNFGKKSKMLLTEDELIQDPLVTRIYDDDIVELGKAHQRIFKAAGYDKMKNGPVPGWALQTGSPWLTRLLDLYRIRTKIGRTAIVFSDYDSVEKITESLNNPIIHDDAYIPRDLRMSTTEYASTRKHLSRLTDELLN